MKKHIGLFLLVMAGLTACGSAKTYKDGTYTGESTVYQNDDGTEDGNGYGVVTLTISGGKISDCVFETFEPDGTLKDEDYGKVSGEIANQDFYNKAQKAIGAAPMYAAALVEHGSTDGVDAISGATINYNSFLEAVDDALSKAAE